MSPLLNTYSTNISNGIYKQGIIYQHIYFYWTIVKYHLLIFHSNTNNLKIICIAIIVRGITSYVAVLLNNAVFFSLAPVTVQFAPDTLSLVQNENISPMRFELVLSGPVSGPFDVEVCTRDGSAIG